MISPISSPSPRRPRPFARFSFRSTPSSPTRASPIFPFLQTRYGVELQFLVNHLGHFHLVNELLSVVRNGSGRIVIVSSSASKTGAPAEGIMFDNLDGRRLYRPALFYSQSKLANALHAKELSRRLSGRGIAVNSLHPGATRGTNLNRHLKLPLRLAGAAAQWFFRSAARGAATQTLLAASPRVAGITGEYWSNCQIAARNPLAGRCGIGKAAVGGIRGTHRRPYGARSDGVAGGRLAPPASEPPRGRGTFCVYFANRPFRTIIWAYAR